MSDLFFKLSGAQTIGFFAVLGVFLWGALIIAQRFYAQAQKTRRAEIEATLKQEMVSRGMSAEEIQMVCAAGTEYAFRSQRRYCRS